ncbi:MAG: BPSS1780 family membrane protein [Xanthomonadales bacterium]|nr:BPSS1780 family membrane protein [Xanthomonadales bacterium]
MHKLPTARALAWLTGSWGLVRRQPVRLLLISLFFQFFLSVSQAGLLGLLVVMCLPVLSAGLLHAFYLIEAGERPMLAVLFIPFTVKTTVSRLLMLGGVVLVLGLLLVSIFMAGQVMDIDPELLRRVEQGDLDALQYIDPATMEQSLLAMALAATVSGMLTYFSVPLIWFRHQAIGRSVLLGLKALGRNWKPLLLIGVLLGLLAVPIVMLVGYFYLTMLSGGNPSTMLAIVLLVLGPLFQLLLFGTQYLAFRDIFGLDERFGRVGKSSTDQLVA